MDLTIFDAFIREGLRPEPRLFQIMLLADFPDIWFVAWVDFLVEFLPCLLQTFLAPFVLLLQLDVFYFGKFVDQFLEMLLLLSGSQTAFLLLVLSEGIGLSRVVSELRKSTLATGDQFLIPRLVEINVALVILGPGRLQVTVVEVVMLLGGLSQYLPGLVLPLSPIVFRLEAVVLRDFPHGLLLVCYFGTYLFLLVVPPFIVGFVKFDPIFEELFAALLAAFLHVRAGLHFEGCARFDFSV